MTEEKIREILPHLCYTKEEVDILIRAAVDEARAIDEASMAKHNREATIISMILGIIPPFAGLDVNIIDQIVEKVETDIYPLVRNIPRL